MSTENIPTPPTKETKKSKPHKIHSIVPLEVPTPVPSENDVDIIEEEFGIDEGILNAREPAKEATETYENPERILH